jgi:uncharacterized protein (DUF362 family)
MPNTTSPQSCRDQTGKQATSGQQPTPINRRAWLAAGGTALASLLAAPVLRDMAAMRGSVFIARNQRYDGNLQQTIQDGLVAGGVTLNQLRGKQILLKPNLVEPSRAIPHMTTHPAMIVAAAEVFRRHGAEVQVGEAPGHLRDTDVALQESGVGPALQDAGLEFADLNYQQVVWHRNLAGCSTLRGFYLPQSVQEADLIVSMPKMKTHHWIGMTASMKNLYGVLPGIKYGWPKNVLHHHGISETVTDINAILTKTITIVDGIDCMEGDGPIMGSCKTMGLVLVGTNLLAVDGTLARIMGLEPQHIAYLKMSQSAGLGPLRQRHIRQHGESWRDVMDAFKILNHDHLKSLRTSSGPLVS